MSKIKKVSRLKSTIKYDKKIAKRLVNIDYYKAQARNMRQIEHIEREKQRLSTPRWEKITELLNFYKELGLTEGSSSTGLVLKGIYNKNILAATGGVFQRNTNLISVVAKVETLMIAYKAIKGNKGALTEAGKVSKDTFNSFTEDQKQFYLKSFTLPDGINLYHFQLVSKLIRKGKYPWGSSLRVYINKPGQPDKLRPLTIPPFMDKVVQKAIAMVLEAIYEPRFEKLNRVFGFRSNIGVQNALIALLSTKTSGMRTAVEGDIEAAYDTVDRGILIKILEKRIRDNKFIKLILDRLNYDFVDTKTKQRLRPSIGIPQGGIDSPYLFNIYMYELDEFVHNELQGIIDNLNSKIKVKRKFSKLYTSNRAKKKKLIRQKVSVSKQLQRLPLDKNNSLVQLTRKNLFNILKNIRLNEHQKNKISSSAATKRILRIFYVRYADDWILVTNGNKEVANYLKEKIADFLTNTLKLNLSAKKTLVTDMTKGPAKFLGFEIRANSRGPLRKLPVKNPKSFKKFTLSRKSCVLLWAQPDKQRIINRFHMKSLCDKSGFPISTPWVSGLESHAIIERYNAVIRGISDFYLPIIRNKAKIHRWIYILRYSCLKTLAQKYRCSIKRIFKRFGYNLHSKSDQTVQVKVIQKVNTRSYVKDWTLLSYKKTLAVVDAGSRNKEMVADFWSTENGMLGNYPRKPGKYPSITTEDYIKAFDIHQARTQAPFGMPCSYCGTFENVQQHHLKHIRKRAYCLIPENLSYQQIMALRNRKQIPLCLNCHIRLVHAGKYDGPALIKFSPKVKLVDNRIIHVESFVKPGVEYFAKSLIEKGWKEIQNSKLSKK